MKYRMCFARRCAAPDNKVAIKTIRKDLVDMLGALNDWERDLDSEVVADIYKYFDELAQGQIQRLTMSVKIEEKLYACYVPPSMSDTKAGWYEPVKVYANLSSENGEVLLGSLEETMAFLTANYPDVREDYKSLMEDFWAKTPDGLIYFY